MNNNELNLRNWREDLRKKKTKRYAEINIYTFIFLFLFMITISFVESQKISKQENVNNYLKSEMKLLDDDLRKIGQLEKTMNQIIERMEIINALQSNRSDLVLILDEIAAITPKEIKLTSLKRDNGMIKIEGISISQLNISTYLKNLGGSDNFKTPRLERVVADEKVDGFERSRFFITTEENKKSSLVSGGNNEW